MKTVICDEWETQKLIRIACTVLLNLPKQSESKIALQYCFQLSWVLLTNRAILTL